MPSDAVFFASYACFRQIYCAASILLVDGSQPPLWDTRANLDDFGCTTRREDSCTDLRRMPETER